MNRLIRRFGSSVKEVDDIPHARLPQNFWRYAATFWGFVGAFIAQDQYFTAPDETGIKRLHPITKAILWARQSDEEREMEIARIMTEARREGEVNVFHQLEVKRPVKDPRVDGRILTQRQWGMAPSAQDIHYVDTADVKWRQGYGEDEDSVEVLKEKPQLRDSKKSL